MAITLDTHPKYSARLLQEFPEELMLQIFKNLKLEDLVAVSEVCRNWCKISKDRNLWTPYFRIVRAILRGDGNSRTLSLKVGAGIYDARYFPNDIVILQKGNLFVRNFDTGLKTKINLPFKEAELHRFDDSKVVVEGKGEILCYDVETRECVQRIETPSRPYTFGEYTVIVSDVEIKVGPHIFQRPEDCTLYRINLAGKTLMIVWSNGTIDLFDVDAGMRKASVEVKGIDAVSLTPTGECLFQHHGRTGLIKRDGSVLETRGVLSLPPGVFAPVYNETLFIRYPYPFMRVLFLCSLETGEVEYCIDLPGLVEYATLIRNRLFIYNSNLELSIIDYENGRTLFCERMEIDHDDSVGVDGMMANSYENILALKTTTGIELIDLTNGKRLRQIDVGGRFSDIYFVDGKLRECFVEEAEDGGVCLKTTTRDFLCDET
ncbi:MAG: F-box protein [Chlamydiales bacterium]|nr:F-box protein [Chlamydiales bacterium]